MVYIVTVGVGIQYYVTVKQYCVIVKYVIGACVAVLLAIFQSECAVICYVTSYILVRQAHCLLFIERGSC